MNQAIMDPCTRFGILDGCKPECPVYVNGDCEIEEEVAEIFDETETDPGQNEGEAK